VVSSINVGQRGAVPRQDVAPDNERSSPQVELDESQEDGCWAHRFHQRL